MQLSIGFHDQPISQAAKETNKWIKVEECCDIVVRSSLFFLFENNNLPTLSLFLFWLCDFVYLKFAQISAYRNQNQRSDKKCIDLVFSSFFLFPLSICQWPVLLSLLTTQIGLSAFLFPHGHILMTYMFSLYLLYTTFLLHCDQLLYIVQIYLGPSMFYNKQENNFEISKCSARWINGNMKFLNIHKTTFLFTILRQNSIPECEKELACHELYI